MTSSRHALGKNSLSIGEEDGVAERTAGPADAWADAGADSRERASRAVVRPARLDEAARIARLMRSVDEETPYMIYGRGERGISPEDIRQFILESGLGRNVSLLIAQAGSDPVGYVMAVGGGLARSRHCVRISALAVRRNWWRRGLGRRLLIETELWAREIGARRLELETMAANDAARGLYESLGFEVEGRRRRAFLLNEMWMDALVLGKLLD